MNKAVVDCSPAPDAQGRTAVPRTPEYVAMTQAELDQRTADIAASATIKTDLDTASLPRAASGRVTLSLLDGVSKAITFRTPIHSADFVVMLNPTASLAASLWTTAHKADGFTLNLSVAVAGTIEYHAEEVS